MSLLDSELILIVRISVNSKQNLGLMLYVDYDLRNNCMDQDLDYNNHNDNQPKTKFTDRIRHHRVALYTIAVTAVLDIILGLEYSTYEKIPIWHGLYCAEMTAVTVGCDVSPINHAGYIIMALIGVLIVPLVGASFSLFTSGITAIHIHKSKNEIKAHLDMHMKRYHDALKTANSKKT